MSAMNSKANTSQRRRTMRRMTRLKASQLVINTDTSINQSAINDNVLSFKNISIFDDFSSGEPLIDELNFKIPAG